MRRAISSTETDPFCIGDLPRVLGSICIGSVLSWGGEEAVLELSMHNDSAAEEASLSKQVVLGAMMLINLRKWMMNERSMQYLQRYDGQSTFLNLC
jgi:hypothetical protein